MNIIPVTLKKLLHDEDIEDLISAGAPEDEYDDEAEHIMQQLRSLSEPELTVSRLSQIIADVWAKDFDRSDDEISIRMPAFNRIATALLE